MGFLGSMVFMYENSSTFGDMFFGNAYGRNLVKSMGLVKNEVK